MSTLPKFYLPIILPPLEDQNDPPTYYSNIQTAGVTVTADTGESDKSLEITVTNANLLHPGNQFTNPRPFATVFAPTSGFVRFYPGSTLLPTPVPGPMNPPLGLTSADFGSVVIRIWISNFVDFIKTPLADAPRANRIALGWLQPSAVETAIAAEITKLKDKVLKKAWEDGGGTGTVPDRTALETAFRQRFMAGDAEIFVSAGAELGSTVLSSSNDAQVKLQAFFEGNPTDLARAVEADDLIISGIDGLKPSAKALYKGHPLVQATDGNISIRFLSTFMIWDNVGEKYVPLDQKVVTLKKNEGVGVDNATTTEEGKIDLTVLSLMKRDMIYFEYEVLHETYGDRKFTEPIATERHRAGKHLEEGGKNNRVYLAKYAIYPKYRDFADGLAANADDEAFEDDRGNGDKDDNSKSNAAAYLVTFASQKGRLMQIEDSEKSFREELEKHYRQGNEGVPSTIFTLLVEGDSWLDYPPAYCDIYGHLDSKLGLALARNKKTYCRFPLQHHGDRSDQMFEGDPKDEQRQWHFASDFLREYKIKLVVCSSGGNDLAEPGIGHWLINPGIGLTKPNDSPLVAPFKKCFTGNFDANGNGGYFNPFKMVEVGLTDPEPSKAEGLMQESFAILLKNHPWNHYFHDKTGLNEQTQKDLADNLDAQFNAWLGGTQFGESNPNNQRLNEIGKLVSALPDFTYPPDPNGDPGQKLLDAVFDSARYIARFEEVKTNWRVLLEATTERDTFVITHTYCYPLFKQNPTTHYGRQTGPWFAPRFGQAKIEDLRIRCICMKALIDHYVSFILQPLKDSEEFKNTFDYVDLRKFNHDAIFWNDEMHLTTGGFGNAATAIFQKLQNNPRFQDDLKE
jgi:hypothetical protein